ncbi:putative odorant receptor 65c [Drosophila subobscura]|uniref:putative odorant receptor 65c n=1 Tax=Drosophila subobscura TaxID=7241 RepID=UPI00155A6029|nr:putative odorant receptor 65c [Drosophila subobscura]
MVEQPSERVGLGLSELWKNFIEVFFEFAMIYKSEDECPKHTVPYFNRQQLKAMGFYPNSEERRMPGRRTWHQVALIKAMIFFYSTCYAVFESLDDIVELGRDLAFIIAAFFIIFKLIYFLLYADKVDEVIDGLEECYRWERKGPAAAGVRSEKRLHFLYNIGMQSIWVIFMVVFIILLISTPLLTQQDLPFHASYPFHLHDPSSHPTTHILIYLSQCFDIVYFLVWLVSTEGMSVAIYSQLTAALSVLCVEFRHLQQVCNGDEDLLRREITRLVRFHQKIISLVDRCNEVFHAPLIMQMIVNFLLVSLSVFEAMMARHDPKVAGQFIVLMILALGHLSMWSKFGDMMSQESLEVAEAAYAAYDPNVGSKGSHKDIRLVILRSQEPLIMRASPFPAFNMINYMAILNQCYGILTLLLNTME